MQNRGRKMFKFLFWIRDEPTKEKKKGKTARMSIKFSGVFTNCHLLGQEMNLTRISKQNHATQTDSMYHMYNLGSVTFFTTSLVDPFLKCSVVRKILVSTKYSWVSRQKRATLARIKVSDNRANA